VGRPPQIAIATVDPCSEASEVPNRGASSFGVPGPVRAAVGLNLSEVASMDLAAHPPSCMCGRGRPVRVVARSVAPDRIAALAARRLPIERQAWQRIARLCVSRIERSRDGRSSRVRNPPDPSQGS
jgi:hypothetical protein